MHNEAEQGDRETGCCFLDKFKRSSKLKAITLIITCELISMIIVIYLSLQGKFSDEKIKGVTGALFSVLGGFGAAYTIYSITRTALQDKGIIYRLYLLRLSAIFDLGNAIVHAFGDTFAEEDEILSDTQQKLCNFQGVLIDLFILWSVVVTMLITIHATLRVVFRWSARRARSVVELLKWVFLPAVASLELHFFFLYNYENTKLWCWIPISMKMERLSYFYIPLWVILGMSFVWTCALVFGFCLRTRKEDKKNRLKKIATHIIRTTFLYQFVIMAHWIPGTLNRVLESFFDQESDLGIAHSIYGPLIPLMTAVVYYFCDSPKISARKGLQAMSTIPKQEHKVEDAGKRLKVFKFCTLVEAIASADIETIPKLLEELPDHLEVMCDFDKQLKITRLIVESKEKNMLPDNLLKELRSLEVRAIERMVPRPKTEDDLKFRWMGIRVFNGTDFKKPEKITEDGQFSIVYEASVIIGDKEKKIAAKVFKNDHNELADASLVDIAEMATLQKVSPHEHVIAHLGVCFDFPNDAGDHVGVALIFELHGSSLLEYVIDTKTTSEDKYKIALQMALAVQQVHTSGVIHRDVALRNFVIHNLHIKIIDFGLARFKIKNRYNARPGRQLPWRLTAPELYYSVDAVYNDATDIWALGLAFIQLCNPYYVPFQHVRDAYELHTYFCNQYAHSQVNHVQWPTQKILRYCPAGIQEVIRGCCSFIPQDRLDSTEVVKMLQAHASDIEEEGEISAECSVEMHKMFTLDEKYDASGDTDSLGNTLGDGSALSVAVTYNGDATLGDTVGTNGHIPAYEFRRDSDTSLHERDSYDVRNSHSMPRQSSLQTSQRKQSDAGNLGFPGLPRSSSLFDSQRTLSDLGNVNLARETSLCESHRTSSGGSDLGVIKRLSRNDTLDNGFLG